MFERKKIGLALGSGGARGFAHIGVIKVLEENNIPIDMIAGTSMGALIGALYSSEPNLKKLGKEALSEEWKKLFDYTFSKSGLIKGKKIEEFLDKRLDGMSFKELKIPLFVTAFDINNNQEVIFHKGSVAKAVRASISIPGLFFPVENKKRILVDGGVIDPIPTEILRKKGADIVIAVNVNEVKRKKPVTEIEAVVSKNTMSIPSVIKSASKSLQMMTSENCDADLYGNKADFVINLDLEKIGTLDFSKAREAIKKGEIKTKKCLDDLNKITGPDLFKDFLKELSKINNNLKKEILQK
ncbi:Patatin-like phospholipase [uncultured archaeon]|nr:Patatin-like phospholipase [uncultured archaeon]